MQWARRLIKTCSRPEPDRAEEPTRQASKGDFHDPKGNAYLYTPMELRGAAVGLLSLLRNEGGSVGTSLSQALQDHREQFHTLRLGENLDPFNPAVQSFLEQSKTFLLQQTGDPALSQQLAWQALENLRQQQASSLAYFDCFWVFAMVTLCLVPAVFLMKRSVAEIGARVGGE